MSLLNSEIVRRLQYRYYRHFPPSEIKLSSEGRTLNQWKQGENKRYRKFVILCSPRTGSSWLKGLLHSHSQIVCMGEVFNFNRIYGHPGGRVSPRLLAWRYQQPSDFLMRYIYRGFPENIKAVGFKLFYSDVLNLSSKGMDSLLFKRNDIYFIHLTRQNLLRTLCSYKIASQLKTWGNRQTSEKVVLSKQECSDFFEKSAAEKRKFDQLIDKQRCITVTYEDLLSNFEESLRDIQLFLGLTPEPLLSRHIKQEKRALSDIIENFDRLEAAFQDTDYYRFFSENNL